MLAALKRYTKWLHTQWPAGTVEKLPQVDPETFQTNVPGLYIVGDLTGIPLLKFSADSGAKAVDHIRFDESLRQLQKETAGDAGAGIIDIAIIGAGVSGMAAALQAKRAGLTFEILEASEPFFTIANFPKAKPIYTYPRDMTPAGEIQFTAEVKEPLLDELRAQTIAKGIEPRNARAERVRRTGGLLEVTLASDEPGSVGVPPAPIRARRVIVGIGRSGNFRRLNVPGEERDKVYNRLHDPKDYCGKHVLVVGGGDSALECAIALVQGGAHVTLSYRKSEFSRPKPDNVEAINRLAKDPSADVQVEHPSSERVTTATGMWTRTAMQQNAETRDKVGSLTLQLGSTVERIEDGAVTLKLRDGTQPSIRNDAVFAMTGREAPLEFFRRSGVRISGEINARWWLTLIPFFLIVTSIYLWKGPFKGDFEAGIADIAAQISASGSGTLGAIGLTLRDPSFYYSLVYTLLIGIFGVRRIKRRKTPYVKWQTASLFAVQAIPLFLLPFIILPIMGSSGVFGNGVRVHVLDPDARTTLLETDRALAESTKPIWSKLDGETDEQQTTRKARILRDNFETLRANAALPDVIAAWDNATAEGAYWAGIKVTQLDADGNALRTATVNAKKGIAIVHDYTVWSCPIANEFFPRCEYGMGREYWRASGLILAWPLFIWNVFTQGPIVGWLIISLVQTFIIIPLIIRKWGKGAYCGWICSCGGLAETFGDAHRHKMPHGPFWNRLNMAGQAILGLALGLLVLRIVSWIAPGTFIDDLFSFGTNTFYANAVDLFLAGILGVGLYLHFSGRVWCRFFCPLAALMHIYARFTRFRILAEKKKCISCNICTSVCHQGIDIMNFANKGLPMADPECVRCSACVQSCPTGVLEFGEVNPKTGTVKKRAKLTASLVRAKEK